LQGPRLRHSPARHEALKQQGKEGAPLHSSGSLEQAGVAGQ
jgi:hypothetical protein